MTTAVQVQYRRGTSSQVAFFTGAAGEMVVDTTNNRVVVQDGSTAGGWPAAKLSEVTKSINGLNGALTISPTDGNVVSASGSTISIGGPGGMVNKFRNGTMDVWQRGTSPSLTAGTSGSQYTADGWTVNWTASSSAAPAISQESGRLLTKNSLQVTGAANITDVQVQQRIESLIAAAFCSQTATVQAEVYNNTGASITPTLTVKHAGSQDNWTSPSTDVNAVSLQACASAQWTQLAYTFSANANSYNGLEIIFDFGNNFSSSGKDVQITECDIRVTPNASAGLNSSPPPPELRPIAVELPFCQRYFQSSFPVGVTPQNSYGSPRVAAYAANTTTAQSIVNFLVPFMTTPSSISFFSGSGGTSGDWEFLGSGSSGATSVASSGAAITNTWMAVNVALSGLTTGAANAS